MAKKKTKKYWKRKADKLWSHLIRLVGFCEVCGKPGEMTLAGYPIKGLFAHHLLTKGAHPKYRHCIDNGLSLCFRCHKWGGTIVDGISICAHGSVVQQQNFWEWIEKNRPSTYEWWYMHRNDYTPYKTDYEKTCQELMEMDTPDFI